MKLEIGAIVEGKPEVGKRGPGYLVEIEKGGVGGPPTNTWIPNRWVRKWRMVRLEQEGPDEDLWTCSGCLADFAFEDPPDITFTRYCPHCGRPIEAIVEAHYEPLPENEE